MSKNSEKTQPIVIKRKKGHHGHHGGAWKIAYADFVTAMMAFFLLMWLLGSTTKGELMGIAEYFQTPLQVALFGGGSGAGDASSLIKGGGQDLTRSAGQVKRGDLAEQKKIINLRAAKTELDLPSRAPSPVRTGGPTPDSESGAAIEAERIDAQALKELKAKIEAMIDASPSLSSFRNQLLLQLTDEGLRIQIIDEQNRPMFDLSSPTLKPYAQDILREIGPALNAVPNRITISGHTDALQYRGANKGGYSNWELSADRANAARREMVKAGMLDDKIIRVVGHGSSVPFVPSKPDDPANRRISIVVLKKSEEARAFGEASAESPAAPAPGDATIRIDSPNSNKR